MKELTLKMVHAGTLMLGLLAFTAAQAQSSNSGDSTGTPESGNITQSPNASPQTNDARPPANRMEPGSATTGSGRSDADTRMPSAAAPVPEKPSCDENDKNADKC